MYGIKWIGILGLASLAGPLDAQSPEAAPRQGVGEAVDPRWQSFEPVYRDHACPFSISDLGNRSVTCGYVLVPEDRKDPTSRLISLSVAKLAASGNVEPVQAVVFLNGGPGGATLEELARRAGTFATGLPLPDSELILFDQRGTGFSDSPFCRAVDAPPRGTVAAAELRYRAALERCVREARDRGIAVDAYSTWHNALDVRDLRRALRYAQWNLWGLSYGTRLARATMDVDPDGIRAVLLDSASPARFPTGFAEGLRSSLDAIGLACSEHARCARDLGDLTGRLVSVIDAYAENPLVLKLGGSADPSHELVVDGDLVAQSLFSLAYNAAVFPDLPILLQALEQRDAVALLAFARFAVGTAEPSFAFGTGMSLVTRCRWDVPDAATVERWRSSEPVLSQWSIAPGWGANLAERCKRAYQIAPDAGVIEHATHTPTLILSGLADPITPPSFAQATASALSNARVIEFPNVGHAVLRTLERFERGCGDDLLARFIRDPAEPLGSPCPKATATPDFLTHVRLTHGPAELLERVRNRDYPITAAIAATALMLVLIVYPVAAFVRHIDRRESDGRTRIRVAVWIGAALALCGMAVVVLAIAGSARAHPIALVLGLPAWVAWAGWLVLLGTVVTWASAVQNARCSDGPRRVGTTAGTITAAFASAAILWFVASLGAGPL